MGVLNENPLLKRGNEGLSRRGKKMSIHIDIKMWMY